MKQRLNGVHLLRSTARVLFFSFLLIQTFSGLNAAAIAQSAPDEQFVGDAPANVASVPHFGFTANGLPGFSTNMNYLMGINADGDELDKSKVTAVGFCRTVTDSFCNKAQIVRYQATLNFCNELIVVDCIKEFTAVDSQGKKIETFSAGDFPGARPEDFIGNPEIGLPSAGPAPLIRIPSLTHSGGDKYLIVANLASSKLPGQKVFNPPNFSVAVYATKIDPTPLSPPGVQTDLKWFDRLNQSLNGWGNPKVSCPIYGWSGCAQRYELPTDVSFGVTIRLSAPVKGWLHGRIDGVTSKISIDKAGYQDIEVQGKPLVLPIAYSWVEKAKASKEIADFYAAQPKPLGGSGYGCLDAIGIESCGPRPADLWVSVMRVAQPDPTSMEEFLAWLPSMGDKATAAPTMWRYETMSNYGIQEQCFEKADSLSGFVSTNATQYLGGPPVFNRQEGTLEYKVAAPHFLPNGREFLGTYDLAVRTSVAQCLYGFSDAPINASISVTSSDGKEKVATTQLVQKDGWMFFSARGFTFSSPTIRVKLTQKVEVGQVQISASSNIKGNSNSTTSTSSGTFLSTSKKTITCSKNGQLKKIVGKNPKCPRGYKAR